MPDAYWIEDPYSPVSPVIQKAAVLHARQEMAISLPELGGDFTADPINEGNTYTPEVSKGRMDLVPGVYLLKNSRNAEKTDSRLLYKNIRIDEYVAPATNLKKTVLWNHSPEEATEGNPLQLTFETVSPTGISKVEVAMSNGNRWKTISAAHKNGNLYYADVPPDMLVSGFLEYRILVTGIKDTTTFPGGRQGNPWNRENRDNSAYSVRLVPAKSRLVLWNAATDWESTYKIWNRHITLKPTAEGETALALQLTHLPGPDPEDTSDRSYAFKFFFGNKIKGRYDELPAMKYLVIKASNLLASPQPVQVGLTDRNGSVMSGEISIIPGEMIYRIPLENFAGAPYLVIPRPFPDFLPYKIRHGNQPFDWSRAEGLQLMVRPGSQSNIGLYIEKIWLE
jgi:hypothetical protein